MKNPYISSIFLLLYSVIGFVPNLVAIDKNVTQFTYLAILNFLYLAFKSLKKESIFFVNRVGFFLFFGFLIWAGLSIFHSFNKSEVIIYVNKAFIFFVSFISISSLIKEVNINFKILILLIVLILIGELIWINTLFFERFNVDSGRDMGLRAFTGNINITAIVLLLKVPFLLYGINEYKNALKKFLIFLLPLTVFSILLMGSRLSNLICLLILAYLAFIFLIKKENTIISKTTILIYIFSLLLAVISNNLLLQNSSSNALERTTNISTSSTDQRLRFYKQALNSISKNPLLGIGAGNWKIESLVLDKDYMEDYIVPYHVHNDYLQVSAELGLLGFLLNYGFYFLTLFFLLKNYRIILKRKNNIFFIVLPFTFFLLDSFFNFPHDRPIIIIMTQIILVLLFKFLNDIRFFMFYEIKHYVKYFLLLLCLPSIFLSYKIYKSYVDQNTLITGLLFDDYKLSNEEVFNIPSDIPSIAATTIPLDIYKANYLFNKGYKNDTLLKIIDKGAAFNPHLYTQHAVKAVYFIRKDELDSAAYYAKKAFYGLPNNNTHFNLYTDILAVQNDSLELEKAYSELSKPVRESFTKKYLTHINSIKSKINSKDSLLAIELIKSKNYESFGSALNIINQVGKDNVFNAVEISNQAEKMFEEKKFSQAAELFEKASKLNPKEIAYQENLANSFMQLNKNEEAIKVLKKVELEFQTTGKTEYLLSLLYFSINEKIKSCQYINKSVKKGFKVPRSTVELICLEANYK